MRQISPAATDTFVRAARFVLVTKGSTGDVGPFAGIGAALARRGNEVVLVTHCRYEAAARSAGIGFVPIGTEEDFESFLRDGPLLDTVAGFLEFGDRHIFPRVEEEVRLLRDLCRIPRTVLVARHMGLFAASIVADLDDIPMAAVFLSAAHAHGFGAWAEFCRSKLSGRINAARRRFNLAEIADWRAWASRADLFLACWPDWFARASETWPAPTAHAGFVISDETDGGCAPAGVEQAFASDAPPVLITGGTAVGTLAARFYAVAMEACRLTNRHAIVVCPHRELLPLFPPAGVLHFAALPFLSVMPRAAAVIHHGGAGTMIRAMAAGVPQLVLPFGGDRPDNAARIEKLHIGVHVRPNRWEAAYVGRMLNELLSSDLTQRELNRIRCRMPLQSDRENACAALEQLAGGQA
jgi:rhamnosyltransferase subunit B